MVYSGAGLFQDYRNRYKFYSTYNLRLHMPPVQFLLAISLPWQYRPPFEGLGLLQSLRLNCRQSGLQEDHEDHELQVPSTASQNWEQDFFSMGGPSQPGPLLMGAGLLQVRVRFWTPRPHLALHWDHWDQVLQLPGTAKWKQFQLIQLIRYRINLKTNKNKRSIKDLSFSRKKKRLRRLMAKPSLFPTL